MTLTEEADAHIGAAETCVQLALRGGTPEQTLAAVEQAQGHLRRAARLLSEAVESRRVAEAYDREHGAPGAGGLREP